MHLTYRPQSEWENMSHENPPYRFLLDCSSYPAGRDPLADAYGNSGSKASSSEIRLRAFSKGKATPKDGSTLAAHRG